MPLLEKEGRFSAKVTAAELGETKTGTPFLQLNFDTEEGSISGRLYLSEKAFDRSLQVLQEAFGFDGNFEDLGQLINQECSITTEFEVWEDENDNSRQSLRVKWINPKRAPEMDAGARKSLAARLSAKAGFSGASATQDKSDNDPF